ncbi:Rrf2 family transcriptional regulator [Rhizobium calliandrae]|uniref:Rrf2 family transcriptional regulator n=1 Tax=Rhizobium calliandrae TaxID=1312182 RepID=A0ABT7KIX1_9HYPH|nr:Rrf2 family transcriptional regulator [Rhizobium calliandrae]MDL2408584.1 Rrf2 family transcriptional regulator [Rhizobium calliandrae]
MIDTRFPTAFQMVLTVAVHNRDGLRCTSFELAAGLGSNPSFVRKLLVPLSQSGILISSAGKNGGIRLGRPAGEITLHDVYSSVIFDKRLWAARDDVPCRCPVSTHIAVLFESVARRAEFAVMGALNGLTIADALLQLKEIEQQELQAADPSCPKAAAAKSLETLQS